MKHLILFFVTQALTIVCAAVHAASTTYDEAIDGKSCKETSSQFLSCEYKIGEDLHISIDGIGQPDTGITFMKSDSEGDFYATYGILHGCIIVKRGPESINENNPGSMLDYAFISPLNGKVYKDWGNCQNGM